MISFISVSLILFIFTTFLYYRRVRQYYIDKSIYELRQCRHDLYIFRGKNIDTLSMEQFQDLEFLIKMVNTTENVFLKIGGLKFKTIKIIVNNTLASFKAETKAPRIVEEHPELILSYNNAIKYSLKAIPFLKFRLISHLVRLIFNFLIHLGIRNAKRNLQKFELFLLAEKDDSNHHCPTV